MNIIMVLKKIEASLTLGSAAEPAIRQVMLQDVRDALKEAPEMVEVVKGQIDLTDFFLGLVEIGEVQVPPAYRAQVEDLARKSRQLLWALEPQFAHRGEDGRWHFSTDLPFPPETLEGYRQRVGCSIESQGGVFFATRGIDYDQVIDGRPALGDQYL